MMILFALVLGDRQQAALLVLAALFLFVVLPLVIIGFIIYRVVLGHTHSDSNDAVTLDLNRSASGQLRRSALPLHQARMEL
jgi:hypothetical protein